MIVYRSMVAYESREKERVCNAHYFSSKQSKNNNQKKKTKQTTNNFKSINLKFSKCNAAATAVTVITTISISRLVATATMNFYLILCHFYVSYCVHYLLVKSFFYILQFNLIKTNLLQKKTKNQKHYSQFYAMTSRSRFQFFSFLPAFYKQFSILFSI